MTVSFFTSPDVDRTVLYIGNGTSMRQEGTILSKRGSRLRHCGCSLAVRQKRLVKLLRISPLVLTTLLSSPTTLLRPSSWSDGALSPLSSTHSLSITTGPVHSFFSHVFSLSIHQTHIPSVSLSQFLSIPHHHTIHSKPLTILVLY